MLGRIFLGRGQRDAAEQCFLEALRNNPHEYSAQHGLKLKRSWFRRQFEEEASILNTVNFDPSARQPTSVANITCLIQELRDEKPKLRFRLLHGLLAMWLKWPRAIRPGGPDDITAFIRFFFQALLFIGGFLLLGTALGAVFLVFGPLAPLGPKVGSYWALGIIVLFLGLLVSVINVSWLTKRWIEQRVAQSKWKTQPSILK